MRPIDADDAMRKHLEDFGKWIEAQKELIRDLHEWIRKLKKVVKWDD